MLSRLFGKKRFQYKCSACGETHVGSPSFSLDFPTYYYDVPPRDRAARIRATSDYCHIRPAQDDPEGDEIYCIRVVLEVPIKGADAPFTWGVWVTQSKDSFERYVETIGQDQSALSSFGWLPVDLPFYNRSDPGAPLEHLECDVQWRAQGLRPKVNLRESAHPLCIDQRHGIGWRQAINLANLANGLT